jgi:PEGA domain-containing protein
MTRQKLTIAAVAAFALSVSPVWAGQRERPAGSESTGSAQPRGGGESSAPSSSGSSSSSGSASSGSPGYSSPTYEAPRAAPSRPNRAENDDQRRGGGSSSSGRAAPRGSSGSSGSGSTASSAGSNDNSGSTREAVPAYSRPRDGRNPTGTAVERRGSVPGGGGSVYYPGVIYDPYYYGYGYYDPYYSSRRFTSYWSPYGYGYGLGYFAYDPYMFGGGYPYGYGGYGYGDQSYGSYGTTRQYGEVGSIRLKVKPNNAQVYIDGYYVGVIDSYDGAFQRLSIEAGSHKVEIRAEGYETVQFEVMVMPGETITYKGELKRIR